MVRDTRSPFRWLLLVLFAGTTAADLAAQTSSGAIAGNIQDASGAVIPGATVIATNDATHTGSAIKSTSAGSYRFPNLPLGTYTVTIVAPGFSTATETGVLVQINSTTALDIQLSPGEVNQTITVDAGGLRLETESSEIDGTISNKQIEDLPLSLASGVGGLRSPETFVFLLPGTTGPGSGTSGNTGNGVFFSRLSGGQRDLDNDGRVDAVVTTNGGAAHILHNETSTANHWLTLKIGGPHKQPRWHRCCHSGDNLGR